MPVFNTPGANANAVKELVIAGLLMAARNLPQALDYVRSLKSAGDELDKAVESGKKQFVGFELPNRTLGVVGLGAIGVEVANAALKLGMNVLGYDPSITVQHAWQLSSGVQKAVNLDDLFARADVVTVHVPLTKATDKLVNGARLEAMRRGGVILNFSRDAIVDSDAVIEALGSGKLRAYVTDFPTRALLDQPKVICLPHLGASTVEAEENCAVMVVDNVREFLENGNVTRAVNFPETVLQRTRPHRVAIPHKNVPNMVAQILRRSPRRTSTSPTCSITRARSSRTRSSISTRRRPRRRLPVFAASTASCRCACCRSSTPERNGSGHETTPAQD